MLTNLCKSVANFCPENAREHEWPVDPNIEIWGAGFGIQENMFHNVAHTGILVDLLKNELYMDQEMLLGLSKLD